MPQGSFDLLVGGNPAAIVGFLRNGAAWIVNYREELSHPARTVESPDAAHYDCLAILIPGSLFIAVVFVAQAFGL